MRIFLVILLTSWIYSQSHAQGLIFDKKAFVAGKQYESERAEFVPSSFSLKAYAPYVLAQKRSTCVAYSTATALAILKAISKKTTNIRETSLYVASPHWIYYRNRSKTDTECLDGLDIEKTMVDILTNGAPPMSMVEFPEYFPFSDVHLCNYYPSSYELDSEAASYLKPDEIDRISSVDHVKAAISHGLPVVFGMNVPSSFEKAFGLKRWVPTSYETNLSGYGHAMVIVGFDDYKYGGAVEIMNSWGKEWGDSGYIWISYSDFEDYFMGGYALYKENKLKANTPTMPTIDGTTKQNDIKLSKQNTKKVKVDKTWMDTYKD